MVDLWSEKLDIHHKDTMPVYNPSHEAPAYQRNLNHFDPFFFANRVVLFLRHISLWWTCRELPPGLESFSPCFFSFEVYNYSLFAHIIVYQLHNHAMAINSTPAKITGTIESVSNMQLFS